MYLDKEREIGRKIDERKKERVIGRDRKREIEE